MADKYAADTPAAFLFCQNFQGPFRHRRRGPLRVKDLCRAAPGRWDFFALQCLFGAAFHAFHAQNTLRAVFAAAGIVGNVYLHGADLFAFAAGDAFAVVALYPEQGEITHGLEKNRNGTDILAESPVVMEPERQKNAQRSQSEPLKQCL